MEVTPTLDGESLRAFAVFAEVLNFTHAAERLHVSQPALHARIRRLADTLGVELYRREGRRLLLTHAGEQLLPDDAHPHADVPLLPRSARRPANAPLTLRDDHRRAVAPWRPSRAPRHS